MYSDTIAQKQYLRKIQLKREEMINLGSRLGLANEKTITCSQELDELLNEYHHLFQGRTTSKTKPTVIKEMSFILYKSRKQMMMKENASGYNILKVM